ncbi:MAG TPA: hypothetical protein VKM54_13295 [Myxococcota bacterium]|nr:hypothetical protein [Myxococcota bacterium]
MSNSHPHRRNRFAVLVGAGVLALSGPAHPDSALPPPERTPSVSIDSTGLRPSRLMLASDQHLLFYNDSDSVARVELDLEHGSGINCAGVDREVLHGRKFVVPAGTVLDCEGPPTNVDYRVFRSGADRLQSRKDGLNSIAAATVDTLARSSEPP